MTAPPSRGLVELRDVLSAELRRSTGRAVDPAAELVVTNGAMHALALCFRSLVRPGDEVVVPAPCFFFEGPIRAAGATPVYVQTSPADGWRWDPEALEAAIGSRTTALLLCNPGNPTGHVPSREEVADAVRVAERHGLLVVTDEAYEAALWDGAALSSAFGLSDDVVVVRSLGKSLSLPQLRLGIVSGPRGAHRRVRARPRVGLPARRPGGPDRRARRAGGAAGLAGRRPRRARRRPGRRPRSRRGDPRSLRGRALGGSIPLRPCRLRRGGRRPARARGRAGRRRRPLPGPRLRAAAVLRRGAGGGGARRRACPLGHGRALADRARCREAAIRRGGRWR